MRQVNLVLGITLIGLSILGMLNIVYGQTPDTSPADGHVTKGLMQAEAGNFIQAHEEFQAALSIDPLFSRHRIEVADFYYEQGMVHLSHDRIDLSTEFFKIAVRLAPDKGDARYALALSLTIKAQDAFDNDRLDRAEVLYAQALLAGPKEDEQFTAVEDNCDLVCEIDGLAAPVMTTATR